MVHGITQLLFWITTALIAGAGLYLLRATNLVRATVALSLIFASTAILFLLLGAQFVGFAQVLVYVGAVTILMLFAIVLTGGFDALDGQARVSTRELIKGFAVTAIVFVVLASSILGMSKNLPLPLPKAESGSVKSLGDFLAGRGLIALEALGILLTAATVAAATIATSQPSESDEPAEEEPHA